MERPIRSDDGLGSETENGMAVLSYNALGMALQTSHKRKLEGEYWGISCHTHQSPDMKVKPNFTGVVLKHESNDQSNPSKEAIYHHQQYTVSIISNCSFEELM